MPYAKVNWQDRVVTYPNRYTETDNGDGTKTIVKNEGTVVQPGTSVSATNLGAMDNGIFGNHEVAAVLYQQLMQTIRDVEDNKAEVGQVTLTNTMNYPFNNSLKTIAIVEDRNTINDYEVSTEVISADGPVGDVIVSGKQTNGFKVEYTGSAKNVTLKYYLRGGIQ